MGNSTDLVIQENIRVKFSEVDSLRIVWHGHYVRYFEDAREAFGEKYKLGYMDVYNEGYTIPIIKITCDFKHALKYGDSIRVYCKYVDSPASKLIFEYKAYLNETNTIVAEGMSTQVFLNLKGDLQLYIPAFFETWKRKHGILK
jgi:acyl-CoA thioester hydrolase